VKIFQIGFEVLTAVSTKMAVFWVVADHTELQPRRQPSLKYFRLYLTELTEAESIEYFSKKFFQNIKY
jgi:hypothetical protein